MVAGQIEIDDNGKKTLYHIPAGEYLVLGRSSSADVTVQDSAVSGHHCKILHNEGCYWLEDLKSRNYTYHNGKKVSGTIALRDGDLIGVGRLDIKFSLIEEKESNPEETMDIPKVDGEQQTNPISLSKEESLFVRIALSLPSQPVSSPQLAECAQLRNSSASHLTLAEIVQQKGYLDAKQVQTVQNALSHILKCDDDIEETGETKSAPNNTESKEPKPRTQIEDERLFFKAIQAKGYLSQKQLDHARAVKRKLANSGKSVELIDILRKGKSITEKQVAEINRLITGQDIPFRIDGYELMNLIGVGGMGYIYKARQVSMDRIVAIKILSEVYSKDQNLKDQFLKEARAVARLNHENIVSGYDFGENHTVSFFVMEFVDGLSLQEILEKEPTRRLSARRAEKVIIQVAKALEHAKTKGLIHHDIKPENILVTRDSVVKLCDLGIAQVTDQKQKSLRKFGTPAFMSPEQIRCEANVDIRSDIYSLGITFYHILFGRLPFRGNSREMMAKHLVEPINFPDKLDESQQRLSKVITKMTAKERDKRYQSPIEIVNVLQEETEAGDSSEPKRTMVFRKKRLRTIRRRRRR